LYSQAAPLNLAILKDYKPVRTSSGFSMGRRLRSYLYSIPKPFAVSVKSLEMDPLVNGKYSQRVNESGVYTSFYGIRLRNASGKQVHRGWFEVDVGYGRDPAKPFDQTGLRSTWSFVVVNYWLDGAPISHGAAGKNSAKVVDKGG